MLSQMLLQNGESKCAFCQKIRVKILFNILFLYTKHFVIAKKNNKNLFKKMYVGLGNGQ